MPFDETPALAEGCDKPLMYAVKCYHAVMIRTQVQLDRDQYERLKVLAARRSKSFAQLVREGVDHVLASEQRGSAWDRFLNAAGSCRTADGATDVAS